MALVITFGYGSGEPSIPTFGYGGSGVAVCLPQFTLDSVELPKPYIVRVRFTGIPLTGGGASNTRGDVTTNYTLQQGTITYPITNASLVSEDAEVIDLYTDTLTAGQYTLTLAATLVSTEGSVIEAPLTWVFEVQEISQEALGQGSSNRNCLESLKKDFNPAFRNKSNWQPVLKAIANADCYVKELAQKAGNQLNLFTASGKYLDRRAGESNIERPRDTGIADDLFRDLAVAIKNNKVSQEAFLDVLEVIYGPEAVRASIDSTEGPFCLLDNSDLSFYIDKTEVTVRFLRSEFKILRRARADEVASIITKRLSDLQLDAYAASVLNPLTGNSFVRVFSGVKGLKSRLKVTGGTAQQALAFSEELFPGPTAITLPTWDIVSDGYTTRFTPTHGLVYNIADVQIGDYVVVLDHGFSAANRGCFTVTNTFYGGVYDQWFEVSSAGTTENVVQCEKSGIAFFRPVERTIFDSTQRCIVSQSAGKGHVEIPVISQIVERNLENGSYLNVNSEVSVDHITASGTTAEAYTSAPHGLSPGDMFHLEAIAEPIIPVPSGGSSAGIIDSNNVSAGILPVSRASSWTSDPVLNNVLFTSCNDLSNRLFIIGGQSENSGAYTAQSRITVFESDGSNYSYRVSAAAIAPVGCSAAVQLAAAVYNKILITGGYSTSPWDLFTDNQFNSIVQLASPTEIVGKGLTTGQFGSSYGFLAAIGYYCVAIPISGDSLVVSDGVTTRTYGFGVGGDVTVTIGGDAATTMANLVTAINGDGSAQWNAATSTGLPYNSVVVVINEKQILASKSGLRIYGTFGTPGNHKKVEFSTASLYYQYDNGQVSDVGANPGSGRAGIHKYFGSITPESVYEVIGTNNYRRWDGSNWQNTFDWVSITTTGGSPIPVADGDLSVFATETYMSGGTERLNVPSKAVTVYDQAAGTWSIDSDLKQPRLQHRTSVISATKALVVGGRQPAVDNRTAYDIWDFEDAAASPFFSGPVELIANSNQRVPGKLGHGVKFNNGSCISTGGPDQTTLNDALLLDYVISGWFTPGQGVIFMNGVAAPAGAADNTLIEFGVDTSNRYFVKWMHGANIAVTKTSTTTISALGPAYANPRYHHFAISKVINGANCTIKLYINGALLDTWTDTKPSDGSSGSWVFSIADGAIPRFEGAVDFVGYSATVLDDAGVLKQYQDELGVTYDNPSDVYASPVGRVLNSCEILSTTGAPVYTGSMAFCRFAHGQVILPDGRVLVCGGVGYQAHMPPSELSQTELELKSVEIYDPERGTWSRLRDMADPHSYCVCALDTVSNRVYIAGGFSSTKTEYLDLNTMEWHVSTAALPGVRARSGGGVANGVLLLSGGSASNGTYFNSVAQDLVMNPSGEIVMARINGDYRALPGTTGSTIFFSCPENYGSVTGGTIESLKAAAGLETAYLNGHREFTLTADTSGRIAAIKILEEIEAAGYDTNIETRYPNDVGLGKNDAPWVWGS
jgi:hypothetical protein